VNCLSSRDLIIAQIPWATAGAERSHAEGRRSAQNVKQPSFNASDPHPPLPTPTDPSGGPIEVTTEERLLAALLAAHEKLVEVLRVYADLEQILHERRAEEQSRKDVRGDHRVGSESANGHGSTDNRDDLSAKTTLFLKGADAIAAHPDVLNPHHLHSRPPVPSHRLIHPPLPMFVPLVLRTCRLYYSQRLVFPTISYPHLQPPTGPVHLLHQYHHVPLRRSGHYSMRAQCL
jgi:hypothetical protein